MATMMLAAAWRYRGFIASSILNEYRTRFARSRFGLAWIVLQPLVQMIIFTTVLSSVLAARLPGVSSPYGYAMYLLAGLLCWTLFAEILQRSVTVFIDQANLLRKMSFPRITLPVIVVGSAVVANLALAATTVALAAAMGFGINLQWLWLIPLMLLTVTFAASLGLLLAVLNVFLRDVGQVVVVLLQFWYWATPIVYPASIVPDGLRRSFAFNPMVPLVESYQRVLLHGEPPVSSLGFTVLLTAALAGLALATFRRASPELVDAL